ncbi:unnamed protein product [Linum tenue]|uniref:NmrA-like domain-containing protein n=1 Tax=Linum tenue TaxID=586396 RepID=A0AAV0MWN6_9ROSI|nr:unnamed protein product [Linum tenue]
MYQHRESQTMSPAEGRTMIIGSAGFIGWFLADACLQSGRPTYLLVRSGPGFASRSLKSSKIKSLVDRGATILHGCVKDGELMEKLIRENKIEVVISAVGGDSYFIAGTDIGKFTMRAVEDPRTLNKTLHFQPRTNLLSINDLARIWESQLGRSLPRVTISEDDLLSAAKEMRIPQSIVAALTHDIFITGCQVNYNLDKPTDVEVCSLYPDASFRSIDDCFKEFHAKIDDSKQTSKPPPPSSNSNKNGIILAGSKTEAVFITA